MEDEHDDFSIKLVEHLSIADHFGIRIPNEEDSKKLKFVWESFGSDINKIIRYEKTLGSSDLDKVYRRLKLTRL